MRTLGFRTHVALVVAAALVLLAALSRPWVGAAPAPLGANEELFDLHGPLRGTLQAAERWVSEPGGTSGWDGLGTWATVLAAVAVVSALTALGCWVPALQRISSQLLRYASFGALAVVAWQVVDIAGADDTRELRSGALIAIVAAVTVFVSAQGVANAPMRKRRVAPPSYSPPPPPPPLYETGG